MTRTKAHMQVSSFHLIKPSQLLVSMDMKQLKFNVFNACDPQMHKFLQNFAAAKKPVAQNVDSETPIGYQLIKQLYKKCLWHGAAQYACSRRDLQLSQLCASEISKLFSVWPRFQPFYRVSVHPF